MTSIDLVVRPLEQNRPLPVCVVPFIDGHDLAGLITEYEEVEGYDPAGGYDGIVPAHDAFGPLLPYYLGRPDGGARRPISVLGCACGELGCWPLDVHVHLSATEVRWTGFAQPHRPDRTYAWFGPFTFDRRQYESTALNIAAALDAG